MREYRVEDLFNGRNYIFQITAGRKLSDIRHSHNFYEIMLLLSGECTHVIEDKKYKMKRGSFVFMLPGENHFFENQAQDTNILGLSVTVNEFEKFVIAYGKEFLAEIKREKKVYDYGDEIAEIYKRTAVYTGGEYPEYECKILLGLFIKQLIEVDKNTYTLPAELSKILETMKNEENIKGGTSAMLRISNYSRTQLARIVKKNLNMTIHDYILELRLNTAYNSILYSDKTTEEIAESVGYESLSHFNRIFKQKFGVTPSMLRKKHNINTL